MTERPIWAIFWALVGIFTLMQTVLFVPAFGELLMGGLFLAISGFAFFSLGVALLVLAVKGKAGGLPKTFLIVTGAAAIGIPISIILHNAIYGLFIHFFGEGFWDRAGMGDEPFFFMMAIFVCPLGFLVGAVGSIVLAVKRPK